MAQSLDRYVPEELIVRGVLPCPCCNSQSVMNTQIKTSFSKIKGYIAVRTYWVYCPVCKMKGADQNFENDALWKWNQRQYTVKILEKAVKNETKIREANNHRAALGLKRKSKTKKVRDTLWDNIKRPT